MAHTALFEHVKLRKLMRALKIPRPYAVGHLECLTYYVSTHNVTGDISNLTDDDIALAAEWPENAGLFVDEMILAGFIDRDQDGTRLHDWIDWCPEWCRKRIQRMRRTGDAGRQHPTPARHGDDPVPRGTEGERASDNGGHCPPPSADGSRPKPCGGSERSRVREEQSQRGEEKDSDSERTGGVPSGDFADAAAEAYASHRDNGRLTEYQRACVAKAAGFFKARCSRDLCAMPRMIQAADMMQAVGVDDTGFQSAVGRKVHRNETAWRVFMRCMIRIANRAEAVETPGAWIRTALRREGVKV